MTPSAVGHVRGQGNLNMPYRMRRRMTAILSTHLTIGSNGHRDGTEGVHEWIGMRVAQDLYLIQRLLLPRLSCHICIQGQSLRQRIPQGLIPCLELSIKVPCGITFSTPVHACSSILF